MATFAIGDVHGQLKALDLLLADLPFDEAEDSLWFVGDLVARGPDSAGVLRRARKLERRLGRRFVAVLGNHDLRLLAAWQGVAGGKAQRVLDQVATAKKADKLLEWLAARPLLHHAEGRLLLHAGLRPEWDEGEAQSRAREAEQLLRSPRRREVLAHLESRSGAPDLERAVETMRVLTRVRAFTDDGRLSSFAGFPEERPDGCTPWYELPSAREPSLEVVCGHWAALGLRMGPGLVALDTGSAWSGLLTAVRLEDRAVFQQPVAAP
jgi:bis(5'-nucleosyl)-tetraphosphatase (symmetrical)